MAAVLRELEGFALWEERQLIRDRHPGALDGDLLAFEQQSHRCHRRVDEIVDGLKDEANIQFSIDRYEALLEGIKLNIGLSDPASRGNREQCVAYLWAVGTDRMEERPFQGRRRSFRDAGSQSELDLDTTVNVEGDVEIPVFVYVRHTAKKREGVHAVRQIRSRGWLGFFGKSGGPLAHPPANGSGMEFAAGLGDWKLDLCRLLFGRDPSEMGDCELPPRAIQRRPEIVERIPDDETPERWLRVVTSDAEIEDARVLVEFLPEGNRVGLTIPGVQDLGTKILHMQVSPTQLRPCVP